jgi:hypothetical protein
VETLQTNELQIPAVATVFTVYPQISWSAIPGQRYGVYDTAALEPAAPWHTNLFPGITNELVNYVVATNGSPAVMGPWMRQTIPAWGQVIPAASANGFFRVQALPEGP